MATDAAQARLDGHPIGTPRLALSDLKADPSRVAAIRETVRLDDEGASTTIGEVVRAQILDCLERLSAAARGHDLEQCAAVIRRLRSRIERADPNLLQPSRGLAGLFDNGRARLADFREAFADVSRDIGEAATDLASRRGGLERRWGRLDALHGELTDHIVELDAWIAASLPMFDAPAPQNALDEVAERPLAELIEDLRLATEKSPLEDRIIQLINLREAAIARLALVRVCQNAETSAPDLNDQACSALETWRQDWSRDLGLEGRRPRRLRPDLSALQTARARLIEHLRRTEDALEQASRRRTAAAERIGRI